MNAREKAIEAGIIRPAVPIRPWWSDAPCCRLLPGERERFEAEAREGLARDLALEALHSKPRPEGRFKPGRS
jgi:hypothetical protein